MKELLSLLIVGLFAISLVGVVSAQSVTINLELASDAIESEQLIIKGTITNTGDESATYVLTIAEYDSWASLVDIEPSTLILDAGASEDFYIYFDVNEDAAGEQIFAIEIFSEEQLILLQPVSVLIEEAGDIEITIYMEGEIVLPEPGYVSGDVLIEWKNVEDAYLKYQEGLCDGLSGGTVLTEIHSEEDGSYEWDTTTVEDEEYCIKLTWGDVLDDVSVIVDNTPPEIEFIGTPYFAKPSETVTIQADILDALSGIKEWELDFGDESPKAQGTIGYVEEIHTYADERKYTVTLTVKDNVGNEVTKTAMVVISDEEVDWTISLYADEPNLISIPLEPEDTDYKEVLADVKTNLDRIWAYTYDESSRENKWEYRKTTSTGSWSTLGSLSDIVPGYGYFIFMKSDDVLYGKERTMSADSNIPPVTPSAVKLANGWNLIGLFGKTSKLIDVALSSLTSLGGEPYWHSVLDMNGEKVADLEPGKGYWISMRHMPDSATEDYYTYYP